MLLSGYNGLARRETYGEIWSDTNNSLVFRAMPRKRLLHIMQNLHCCDNQSLNIHDKFIKIRRLQVLINKFIDLAPLQEHNNIEGFIISYYGRHPIKQCIRGKPKG